MAISGGEANKCVMYSLMYSRPMLSRTAGVCVASAGTSWDVAHAPACWDSSPSTVARHGPRRDSRPAGACVALAGTSWDVALPAPACWESAVHQQFQDTAYMSQTRGRNRGQHCIRQCARDFDRLRPGAGELLWSGNGQHLTLITATLVRGGARGLPGRKTV